MAVKKGGAEGYINDPSKSEVGRKELLSAHDKAVVCRLTLTPHADHALDQLAAVLGMSRGQIAGCAIEVLALTYNGAVRLLDCRPDLDDLLDRLITSSI